MGDPDVRETGRAGAGGSVFAVGAGRGAVTLALPGVRARLDALQRRGSVPMQSRRVHAFPRR